MTVDWSSSGFPGCLSAAAGREVCQWHHLSQSQRPQPGAPSANGRVHQWPEEGGRGKTVCLQVYRLSVILSICRCTDCLSSCLSAGVSGPCSGGVGGVVSLWPVGWSDRRTDICGALLWNVRLTLTCSPATHWILDVVSIDRSDHRELCTDWSFQMQYWQYCQILSVLILAVLIVSVVPLKLSPQHHLAGEIVWFQHRFYWFHHLHSIYERRQHLCVCVCVCVCVQSPAADWSHWGSGDCFWETAGKRNQSRGCGDGTGSNTGQHHAWWCHHIIYIISTSTYIINIIDIINNMAMAIWQYGSFRLGRRVSCCLRMWTLCQPDSQAPPPSALTLPSVSPRRSESSLMYVQYPWCTTWYTWRDPALWLSGCRWFTLRCVCQAVDNTPIPQWQRRELQIHLRALQRSSNTMVRKLETREVNKTTHIHLKLYSSSLKLSKGPLWLQVFIPTKQEHTFTGSVWDHWTTARSTLFY